MAGIGTPTQANGTTTVTGTVTANQGNPPWSVALTAAQISTLTPLATVAVTQGTSPWVVSGSVTASGTVTANQGTANATPWNENLAQIAGSTARTAGTSGVLAVGGFNAEGDSPGYNPMALGIIDAAGHIAYVESATAASGNAGNRLLGSGMLGWDYSSAYQRVKTDTAGKLYTATVDTVAAVTAITNALPAGSNVIGHVVVDSGSITANAGSNLNTSALALESGGNLATIVTNTNKIPALGQALAASSVPVVLTALQLTALTPPSNTGYALDASLTTIDTDIKSNITLHAGTNVIGHVITDTGSVVSATLAAETTKVIGTVNQGTSPWVASATLQTQTDTVMIGGVNIKEINAVTPLMGNGITGTGSQRVTIASDNTPFSVNATLAAETTKVIGVTRSADGGGNLLTTNSTTYTAKFGLDSNLLGTLGTAFSTAGKVDVKAADGDVFIRQATAANLNATVQPGNTANTTPWLVDIHATAAALADTTTNPTTSLVGSMLEAFNGTSWDRVRNIAGFTDGAANNGVLPVVLTALSASDTGHYYRITSDSPGDNVTNTADALITMSKSMLFNNSSWDRWRNNYNVTTGDTPTIVSATTTNGATQTNYNARGAYITVILGTVSGTTPALKLQFQYSPDGGTTWVNFGPVSTSLTVATGNTLGAAIYPSALTATLQGTTTPADNIQINAALPRIWRIQYITTGTGISIPITSVNVNYLM